MEKNNYVFDMLIEIPYNSFIKYEYDKELNKMRCDRVLSTSMGYPGNYGYIPNTISGDNDPIDVLMISDYMIHPGTIISGRVIGGLLTTDENGDDEKIIAVPDNKVDPQYNNILHHTDLPTYTLSKIKHFFEHYKDMEKNKWVKVKHFADRNYALELIENAKYKYLYSQS